MIKIKLSTVFTITAFLLASIIPDTIKGETESIDDAPELFTFVYHDNFLLPDSYATKLAGMSVIEAAYRIKDEQLFLEQRVSYPGEGHPNNEIYIVYAKYVKQ